VVTATYEGTTVEQARAACGWPLRAAAEVGTIGRPTDEELRVLRDLQARTKAAHAVSVRLTL
jgi:glutaconate CoA-transferase subunit B